MDYIDALESSLGRVGNKKLLPIQSGDVPDTYADVDDLVEEFDFKPNMSLEQGIDNFVRWFKEYYHINI